MLLRSKNPCPFCGENEWDVSFCVGRYQLKGRSFHYSTPDIDDCSQRKVGGFYAYYLFECVTCGATSAW
jgi:hypothetical protein